MSMINNNKIGELSIDNFLLHYWQKKPLLIRQAIPHFKSFISADELAGLSLEEHVESRLIIEKGLHGNNPWQVVNGPLDEAIFTQLPENNWTLLVQEANHHIPQLQQLADYFSFIPCWRFDDIMISYATKNGSVGPHKDYYDVFLLQAQGQRHWHIADYPTSEKDLIADIDCKILKEFHSQQDWILNPGDMLYLPPGILHHGIAIDECMTYSIGFNARTNGELLNGIIPYATESNQLSQYYCDPDLTYQKSSGEIATQALDKMENLLLDLFKDKQQLRYYLACYLTESANPQVSHKIFSEQAPLLTKKQLKTYITQQGTLYRNESYRFAYLKLTESKFRLFIDAQEITVSTQLMSFIPVLTATRILDFEQLSPFIALNGWLEFIFILIDKEYLLTEQQL